MERRFEGDYQPLYRFYEGGSLTRTFRAVPAGQDGPGDVRLTGPG